MKIRELIAAVNDFVDTWQRHSAVIATIFGERDVDDIKPIIDIIKGFLGRK